MTENGIIAHIMFDMCDGCKRIMLVNTILPMPGTAC